MNAAMLTLPQLPLGTSACIATVGGEDRLRRRLLEMGLVPGTTVTLTRRAPMGDPLEFSVRGYRLSLRAAEACHIAVHRA
jgi:Fe2+ transport system protein FeoA